MVTLRIIWDVLFRGDTVTVKGTDAKVAKAMDAHCSDHKIEAVLRWNTVLPGQKVSRVGFTSGLRYLIPVDHLSSGEIQTLLDSLSTFKHDSCESSNCIFSESLEFPLNRRAKARFPVLGQIALICRFTHGIGYTDLVQINTTKKNQTKDTKNGLDPIRTGKGSSSGLFTSAFRGLMNDSLWFLILSTTISKTENDVSKTGYYPPNQVLSKGADGGMYQLDFDLRDGISDLIDTSKGIWWEPLDSNDLNLNPQLTLDPETVLNNKFDPEYYHHHNSKVQEMIEKVLKVEMEQTGDKIMRDDLQRTLGRLTRIKRIKRQITGVAHGLVSGLEVGLISEHIMRPWIAEEFFNSLAFFLMTRKPRYWRNGKSEILLFHPLEGLDIDLLKDQ